MKTPGSLALLFSGAALLATAFPAAAQPGIPSENSRPVISPGKAGAPGAQGANYPAASPALNATVAEIMARPDNYAGRNVTVTSEVEQALTPWTLRIDEDRVLTGGIDADMLVVGMEPLVTMGFDPSWVNREVRITGTVRVLQAADFRRDYGRGVDDRMFRRFEGKPALVATSMTLVGAAPAQSESSGASDTNNPTVTSGASGASGNGASGSEEAAAPAASGTAGIDMECRPSSVHCPITDSSGSSVTTTDSLPLGSVPDERDPTVTESQYPTSRGSGSVGSGTTGVPAGPDPGPVLGIGR